jgi:hypothetical protein
MKRTLTLAALPLTILAAGLALLAPGSARAAAPTSYTIQAIAKLGDKVADVTIKAAGDFEIGGLNDQGQLAFVTENGGTGGGEMLLQYADAKFLPVVVAGRDAPGGKWTSGNGVYSPVQMNQRGDIAFSTTASIGGTTGLGTFRWDYQSQKSTLVAFKGMPAVNNLTFVNGSNESHNPLINNNDEIAFPANVKNAAGATRSGAFFLGKGGQIQAVALPDQALPDGATVQSAFPSGINDNGVVAFVTYTGSASQPNPNGVYLWEKGTITPVAAVGMEIPGLGKVVSVFGFRANNKDRTALVPLRLNSPGAPVAFYRWANGQFTLLFTVGQDMPGGGTLKQYFGPFGLNDAGQFAFLAQISENGRTLGAAYLLDTDGTLSLILKSGATTALGTITQVLTPNSSPGSMGIGLNSKGQVALPVKLASGPATLVLLTPAAP